ncbi:hypothetical protein F0L68_38115 [Solihabitans fulvus]|uniref:Uncharacterized protein n=1 Tax=Solihabitans fulvus TaxID=1892852 RepID=A0A5B2WL80_9PSEU|nr:hypothetical protein [Solihabitans fulvus]KAA2251239.1 hypothetical protein F0L68_38115 [Solihabitans fulvus]
MSRRRRRLVAVLGAFAVLVGVLVAGRVLASDPIAYGVPVWPFANTLDGAENQQLDAVTAAIRAEARGAVGNVADVVRRHGVEVLSARIDRPADALASVLLELRFRLRDPGQDDRRDADTTRCRSLLVRGDPGLTMSSRALDCP